MKVALLYFASPQVRRAYQDAMRARLYADGLLPHEASRIFDVDFYFDNEILAAYAWENRAELACSVAKSVRGVICKLRDESELEQKPPTIYERAKARRRRS